jgi:1,4-alpha-glucan branching enzyme
MLQAMNTMAYGEAPGAITVAEESTSYPKVSAPVDAGGLGFGFKWNMGWMNDTLSYMARDPVYRPHHHNQMTFGLVYAFSENFILPISHDEVVHGKGSMLSKMPGNRDEQFANLRAYYGFMWAHPGKKLLFMGQEFAQPEEWNHDSSLPWHLLDDPAHAGMQRLVRDLNTLYRGTPALHALDAEADGFQWIEADDAAHSVFAWLRRSGGPEPDVVVAVNFTPVERPDYRIGLPFPGDWRETLNTDAQIYGGRGRGNMGKIHAGDTPSHGQPASARVYLPPLSAVYLVKA